MPSLNRPNAPQRLPSADIDRSFFQPKARRAAGSAGSLATSSPSPSLSPGSPTTLVSQRKASRAARRRLLSEGITKTTSVCEVVSAPTTLEQIASGIAQDDPSLRARRLSGESLASEPSSSRSSISSRARKLLNIPSIRVAGSATKVGAPPRKAKKGFRWQHETSGHWVEIRIGKTRCSDGQSRHESVGATTLSQVIPAASQVDSTHKSNICNPDKQHAQDASNSALRGPPVTAPTHKEGLYCWAKRRLRLMRGVGGEVGLAWQHRTTTGEMLDRTASMLRVLADKKHTPPSSSTSTSTLSIAAPRWQLLRPGHGRRDSSSSSIRSLMMGKPPPSTPEAQETYIASDQKSYFTVELTALDAPAFLPSEARRIKTPPLKSAGSDKSNIRGFFFDYNAPPEVSTGRIIQTPALESHTPVRDEKERRVSETEWYRITLDAIEAEAVSREHVVSQVPDHLPNSPLCPKHPRHKLAGSGICPMHGGNESSRLTARSDSSA